MDNVSGRQRVRDEDVKGVELPPGARVCVSPALCLPLSVPRWKGKCRLSGCLSDHYVKYMLGAKARTVCASGAWRCADVPRGVQVRT